MWQLNTEIIKYLPDWFKQIIEYEELCKSEKSQFEDLLKALNTVSDNFFFQTMDNTAVSLWEKIFNIIPNLNTESIEFRRSRLINRISTQPPFTLSFLYRKLDEIIGEGLWKVTVDYPNYTLYIESSAENQDYAIEVSYTVNKIKPAHTVYINKPLVVTGVCIDEKIGLAEKVWNYKLGAWGLGLKPFVSSQIAKEVVPLGSGSVQQKLLDETAASMLPNIAKARINGSIIITEIIKSSSSNIASVSYTVKPSNTALITQIELLDAGGNTLTTSPVYVPVTENVIINHNIPVKEAK